MNVREAFLLDNKVAIVTGACGLLGQQHCRALAEAGASVVVADLDGAASKEFAAELGKQHLGVDMDVTDRESLNNVLQMVLRRYERVDVLVNNAAINDMFENPLLAAEQSRFENYPFQLWQRSLDVNISGVFLCSQVFGSVMAEQNSGSIINIASTYGVVAPDQSIYINEKGEQDFFKSPSYPVTKSAVIGFTKYLAAYWGHKNVRVNALSPGGVENSQQPFFVQNYARKTLLNRMAKPGTIRRPSFFLPVMPLCI